MGKTLNLPWGMEQTIENFKELKEGLQEKVIIRNLHGRGEKDAEEIAFDFDRAIGALEMKEKHRWIPVTERLPEKDGFYLATCDGEICGEEKPFVCLAEFENGKWVDDEEDYQCIFAWQPLPAPYIPEQNKPDVEELN